MKNIIATLEDDFNNETILFGIGINSLNRFETFLKIKDELKGKKYWYNLKVAYTDSDDLFRYSEQIKECFSKKEPEVYYLMDFKELDYLKSLPEKITIYRAMTESELVSGVFGVSWTLKKDIAEFFCYKYQRNYSTIGLKKVIHKITIYKKDIIAFFNNRNEFEIIYIHK